MVEYYLFGTGGTVLDVINSTMGLDIASSLDQANSTLTDLRASRGLGPLLRLVPTPAPCVLHSFKPPASGLRAPMPACTRSAARVAGRSGGRPCPKRLPGL